MAKTPLQFWKAQSRRGTYSLRMLQPQGSSSAIGVSLLLSVVISGAWLPAASARPVVRVQGTVYSAPTQTITFPPVLPFSGSVYNPVSPIVQSGSGFGLSVQVGTPSYYPSNGYPSSVYPSGYIHRHSRFPQQQGNVNNSVLINPTVINGSIRNSTLVNPTIVTTPYAPAPYYPEGSYPSQLYPSQSYPTVSYPTLSYPTPYYDVRTVIPTTRPEPQVVIDPQYGVRYQSPPFSSERQVVIDPQYGVRYSNPSGY